MACVQTILVPDERWDRYRKAPDWIERYVFPGCLIPSLGALSRALAGSRLEVRDVDEIGPHYAETLRRWRDELPRAARRGARARLRPRFERTWDFYLAFCEAAFRTGSLRDAQLTLRQGGRVNAYELLERVRFRELAAAALPRRIAGAEHVPASGPVILVANHDSMFDPWLLALVTPRPVRYMAKSELWRYRPVARVIESFGAFPVERGDGRRDGDLGRRVQLLRDGEVLGMFPQGTSKRRPSRPYHRGAARLALATGAPVVPVGMIGTRGVPAARAAAGRDRRRGADRGAGRQADGRRGEGADPAPGADDRRGAGVIDASLAALAARLGARRGAPRRALPRPAADA